MFCRKTAYGNKAGQSKLGIGLIKIFPPIYKIILPMNIEPLSNYKMLPDIIALHLDYMQTL